MASLFDSTVASLNTAVLSVFGDSVIYRRGVDEYSIKAVRVDSSSSIHPDQDFVSLDFRRSDIPAGEALRGDTVIAFGAEWRVVEVDQRVDDWTKTKIKRMKALAE